MKKKSGLDDSVQPNSADKNITTYKITFSILFGLLGFVTNLFLTIKFDFPPFTAVILIGLLFPLLIALAWGWKYGLLSALVGGSQSMWWLWGPSNGYAVFFIVPPFTLWILWHGIIAGWRKKQATPKWWLNAYVVEIPFRIFNTINLYTLTRWAITLNPPAWSWASDAPNTVPMLFSNFVVIKQAAVGYVILLLADVLLNLGFIRKFFKLEEKYDQTNTSYIISASLLIGVFFWFVDSIVSFLVFHSENSFLNLLALNIPPHDIFIRTMFLFVCLMGGLLASRLMSRQRESVQAMLKSEELMRTMFEEAPLGIALIDSLTGQFIEVNPKFSEISGQNIEKMTTIDWRKITHPDDVREDLEYMAQMNAGNIPGFDINKRFVRPDGTILWFNMTIAPITIENKTQPRHLCMIEDITERVKAEEEIIKLNTELEQRVADRTAQLEASNNALEAFSYSVSHDLRAPLSHMGGFAEVLNRRIGSSLDEKSQRQLGYILDAAKQMGTLIDDLLRFSRMGRVEMHKTKINLEQLVRQVVVDLEPERQGQGTIWEINELNAVYGDPSLLRQVIVNLLSNAVKFTGKREQAHIEISSKKGDYETVIRVHDNGVGFDMQYVDKLFGVFQRLHHKKDFEGTGIGLANVRRIINRHGGRTWAEGSPENGASFYFSLPNLKEGEMK